MALRVPIPMAVFACMRGIAHYKVYKEDTDTGTNSHIRRLTDEERVQEIAYMLSGATLTEAAVQNARALLGFKQ